jgi:hypothetical protein
MTDLELITLAAKGAGYELSEGRAYGSISESTKKELYDK